MTARYNIYYNGTVKLDEAVQTLALNHKDDYSRVLDVFPYGDEAQAKAQAAAMDEIIKKGSKIILDRPVSKWVDDGYLLVGKAYFFKADYYAAIETFQYINSRYKNTEVSQEATLWILKSYIRLKRYDDAEALVGYLKNEKNFPPRLTGLFAAASAEIMIKQGKYPSALKNMKVALANTKKRTQKARYNYITAQLFERLGKPDSAKFYLNKTLRLNPPYEMAFQAKISLARNYDPKDKGQVRTARRYLRNMLRDDKNISYYDQIYYQLGVIEYKEGNTGDAIRNFRMSLDNSQDQHQKTLSYLALADLYYAMPNYPEAQLYYDSTVKVIQTDHPDYNSIIKKQAVLSELIKYKVIVAREDSLQYLATLTPAQLDAKVDQWIRDEEEKRKKAERDKENRQQQVNPGGGLPTAPGNNNFGAPTAGGSNWYFYSQQQKAIGYNDFLRRWGNRKLTDDWRFSQKEKITSESTGPKDPKGDDSIQPQDTGSKNAEFLLNVPEARKKYYRDIPFAPEDKKASDEKTINALFNIGVIYYEKLGDDNEAVAAFETLLSRYPGNEKEAITLYYLHKIFAETDPTRAKQYLNKLNTLYPDFRTDSNAKEEPKVPQYKTDFYSATFDIFKQANYTEVKNRKPVADTMLVNTVLMPKYDLLYAMSVGKTESIENYKTELSTVMAEYPGTEVAIKAKELLEAANRLKQADTAKAQEKDTRESAFVYNPDLAHFVAISFPVGKGDANAIRSKISDFNHSTFPGKNLEVVGSFVNSSQQLVVIRTFESKDKALDYLTQIEKFHVMMMGNVDKAEADYFVITPPNYSQLLSQKDLAPYKSFYQRNYLK